MRCVIHFLCAGLLWLACMFPAQAQESDKDFLTRSLQDALSGAGRTVSIDGFEGALSSSARFVRMTIADADGVWLTLEDVELVWTRSALLRGRLEVDQLTAARLDIPRLPVAEEDALPTAEAEPFSLPELPVSIEIQAFSVDQITLGAPVLGAPVALNIAAEALYTDDVLNLDFQANRTDDKAGQFAIRASFERGQNLLDLALTLTEGAEGIAARLLNLPGQPSVDMTVAGSGPLDDFATDLKIATDGQDRLAGSVSLATVTQRGDAAPDRRVQANIGGDITALLAPRFRDFFGTDVALTADALLMGSGAVELRDFTLNAEAAQLAGTLSLNAERWPSLIDITGTIANDQGTALLLPVGGAGTTVERVGLRVAYDAADGEAFDARFDIDALTTQGVTIDQTTLELLGTLQGNLGSVGQFLGDVTFDAQGLALTDAASAEAVGDRITGRANINYIEGQPTRISDLDLTGTDYGLQGFAVIRGLGEGFATRLEMALEAADLSRFSALAGQELDGQTALSLKGNVTPLSGMFDLNATGTTQDLALGIAQADAVLAGRTELRLQATRDDSGTMVRDMELQNDALSLTGGANLRTDNSRARAVFTLRDVGVVLPEYSGPVTVAGLLSQDARGWSVDAATDGPYGAALTAKGLATGPEAALSFTADVPNVQPFAPDINGPVKASGTLRQSPQGWRVDTSASGPYRIKAMVAGLVSGPDMSLNFDVSLPNVAPLAPGVNGPLSAQGRVFQTPQGIAVDTRAAGPYSAQATVKGVVTGAQAAVEFTLGLPNVGAFVEQVNGPLNVTGSARQQGAGWQLDTRAQGPGGTQATVAGLVGTDGRLNLDLAGTAPLGLSRPFIAPRILQGQARFDLAVNGPPALSSVSGTVATSGASLSAPNLRLALQDIAANIRLGGNRAAVDLRGTASNGGSLRVDGGIGLAGSLPADLQIGLENVVLLDPRLYRTSVNGALQLTGPLAGGARIGGVVNVGETEVSVPATGLTSIGDIPPITHIGASPAVRATQTKAGINGAANDTQSTAGSGAGFGLDVQVNAPNRIFVRGRGLDAELGGALRLTGTTNNIISAGRFELLRGRLDILGKRFELVEGSAQFQGDFVPFLRFVSTTTTQTGTASVIVEGPADAPEVTFASSPDAPQDEVLAQLLFGRNIADISAFQAVQLASAVATLAGRGGSGVVARLRDGFGLDDFDVTTTDEGETALRAGKYISDNVYTDVTAASDGTGEVSLNLDITPNLTGKATVETGGNSSLGVFFERDY